MSYTGSGGVWHKTAGDFEPQNTAGTQAGFDAAKARAGSLGGFVQVGPGLEAFLVLGAFAANTGLIWLRNDGKIWISGLGIADHADPTKRLVWDLTAIGSSTERIITMPNWNGKIPLPIDGGLANQFLRSNGAALPPTWEAVTHALLDGSLHTDTLAAAVVRGDLIVGNSTPKWARLPHGTSGQVLSTDGTDVLWTSLPTAVRHDSLAHVVTFTVAQCKLTNGSAVVTTTASGFLAGKIGDRIYLGATPISHTSLIGAKILTVDSDTQVTLDRTFTGGTTGFDQTATVVPYDHNGHLLLVGAGSPSDSHDGLQQIWGNLEWRPASTAPGGVSTGTFLVGAGSIPNNPNGFGITNDYSSQTAYFDCTQLTTGAKIFRFPKLAAGANGTSFAVCGNLDNLSANQQMDRTDLTTNNSIRVDGTAAYTTFNNAGGTARLGFDLTPMAALRATKWPDHAGTVRVQALVAPTYGVAIATDVNAGTVFKITVTDGVAFTVSNPTLNASDTLTGKEITYDILNSSGGAMGAITWGAQFLLAGAFTNPANTKRRTIRFYWDGTNWVEICRAAADI